MVYSSDYFDQLYAWAVQLIQEGKAYVDFSTAEEMAIQKGSPTEPGTPNRYRDTSPEENLALFEKMRIGEFGEGACVLRAKLIWHHRICTSEILCYIESNMRTITGQVINGSFTLCMTGRMGKVTVLNR